MRDAQCSQFTELVNAAREYCNLIDLNARHEDWLSRLSLLLPRLHASVVTLHDPGGSGVEPEYEDLDDRFDLYSELRERLGERDVYWLEFDRPEDVHGGEEHRTGSLADDLTDIYFELKRGLCMLNKAGSEPVVRFWGAGFRQHWGQHLVDAERHLYRLTIDDRLESSRLAAAESGTGG